MLFWVNLARKDKQAEPSAQVLLLEQITVRKDGDATVRVLVGEGSPVQLGTPAIVYDVEFPDGGGSTTRVPSEFQASSTCSTARPRSVPTRGRRSLRSSCCSVPVRSSR